MNTTVPTHYSGELKDGVPHGDGCFYNYHGVFTGRFEEGRFVEGEVKFTSQQYRQFFKKGETFIGKLKDGHPHGEKGVGIYFDDMKNKYTVEGKFHIGKPTGVCLFTKDAVSYRGVVGEQSNISFAFVGVPLDSPVDTSGWSEDDFKRMTVDEGICFYSNGTIYKGPFKNGVYEGQGLVKLMNNDYFKGLFKNNFPEQGVRYDCHDHPLFEGLFNKDYTLKTGVQYIHYDVDGVTKTLRLTYNDSKVVGPSTDDVNDTSKC